jgi:hypothetical protein
VALERIVTLSPRNALNRDFQETYSLSVLPLVRSFSVPSPMAMRPCLRAHGSPWRDGLKVSFGNECTKRPYEYLEEQKLHPKGEVFRSICEYSSDDPDDLSFPSNALILVFDQGSSKEDWWEGVLDGKVGVFPGTYVTKMACQPLDTLSFWFPPGMKPDELEFMKAQRPPSPPKDGDHFDKFPAGVDQDEDDGDDAGDDAEHDEGDTSDSDEPEEEDLSDPTAAGFEPSDPEISPEPVPAPPKPANIVPARAAPPPPPEDSPDEEEERQIVLQGIATDATAITTTKVGWMYKKGGGRTEGRMQGSLFARRNWKKRQGPYVAILTSQVLRSRGNKFIVSQQSSRRPAWLHRSR